MIQFPHAIGVVAAGRAPMAAAMRIATHQPHDRHLVQFIRRKAE